MIAIHNILVPLDLSQYSSAALPYACELASAYGSRIHLLHVVETPWGVANADGVPDYGDCIFERLVRDGEIGLSRIADNIDESVIVPAVEVGLPHVKIVQYARDNDIDVIVLATHGRSGLKHALIGSVAEKVVQMAACPVLTIKHPEPEFILP